MELIKLVVSIMIGITLGTIIGCVIVKPMELKSSEENNEIS